MPVSFRPFHRLRVNCAAGGFDRLSRQTVPGHDGRRGARIDVPQNPDGPTLFFHLTQVGNPGVLSRGHYKVRTAPLDAGKEPEVLTRLFFRVISRPAPGVPDTLA